MDICNCGAVIEPQPNALSLCPTCYSAALAAFWALFPRK